MTNPGIFNQILIWPILNILIALYKIFEALRAPGAFGLAIIGLTILIRFLLSPLFSSQLKSAQKMQELKPKIDELSQKYGKDKARIQQEQLRLYKEAGVNPAAGCLPLLLQMPVFIALYNVFWQILGNGNLEKVIQDINQVVYFPILKIQSLDLSFFGINLASKPSSWQTDGWWLLIIPLATAILQWYQTRLMSNVKTQMSNVQKEKTDQDDMAKIMQTQMSYLFPLMIGWFAFSFPVGLSLYWNTFTVLGIIQQIKMKKAK
ncbi:YidC/Oxa1 family membrane protein insertase [Candidatus Gottesmanbacteria bacterium]|nr:YidC/Oxa1 family membrane protein insertase [Candidatus Gottesmanbacteria bacterium]